MIAFAAVLVVSGGIDTDRIRRISTLLVFYTVFFDTFKLAFGI